MKKIKTKVGYGEILRHHFARKNATAARLAIHKQYVARMEARRAAHLKAA